eukprot:4391323-Pleurochrysis_carterae.AAC.1
MPGGVLVVPGGWKGGLTVYVRRALSLRAHASRLACSRVQRRAAHRVRAARRTGNTSAAAHPERSADVSSQRRCVRRPHLPARGRRARGARRCARAALARVKRRATRAA